MSIFQMHQEVIDDYRDYVRSFQIISDNRIEAYIEEKLVKENKLWPDALIQINPAYERVASVEDLTLKGVLHPDLKDFFRTSTGNSLQLYRHQVEAVTLAQNKKSFVVTSGTGSGKSLTYLLPIFDAVSRTNPGDPKVRAIIVYPMNALVNSQYEALNRFATKYFERTGRKSPVIFDKYTGQEKEDVRDKIRLNPPHILLTNYVMLELFLVRPEEHTFVDAATTGLQYLVIDELHTYRGRQGADVALLIRRLRSRCGNPDLLCIGTSATMVAGEGTTALDRRTTVALFAGSIFGDRVEAEQVIEESLQQITASGPLPTPEEVCASFHQEIAPSYESLTSHPLARWIELTFGIEETEPGVFRRKVPIRFNEGVDLLAAYTGEAHERCETVLRDLLYTGSRVRNLENLPLFGFKLHQFISQGRTVYATLEDGDSRAFSLDGLYYAPGENVRLYYPLRFCRICGQEYYLVVKDDTNSKFIPMDESIHGDPESGKAGYLMLSPPGLPDKWPEDHIPGEWFDKNGKLKKPRRENIPQAVHVLPDGTFMDVSITPLTGSVVKAWFQPKPFMLCQTCQEFYGGNERSDFRKLTGLASEGRSTSTTVLSLSAYRHAPSAGIKDEARKVLSFTDNRQDASLQAGHFNDFVQVSFLRGAILRALQKDRQCSFDQIGNRVLRATTLTIRDVAKNEKIDNDSPQARIIWQTFQELLEYRIFTDLQRGWRVIQPNLEQCGLLQFSYRGLDDLCENEKNWANLHRDFQVMPPDQKQVIITNILDFMRRKLAIQTQCFDPSWQNPLQKRVYQMIHERWQLDFAEGKLIEGYRFTRPGFPADIIRSYSLNESSIIGRFIKRYLPIRGEEYKNFVDGLLDVLASGGIIIDGKEKGVPYVQIDAATLLWNLGDGTSTKDLVYSRKVAGPAMREEDTRKPNPFFVSFYQSTALQLRGLEGREHTAQISYENREDREKRFRKGELSCLFCSPTMELGIDIADLQLVHMRNVPPTPANYAQRSGRAGRSGDPAMVLTYCSAGSGHDQYFFRNQEALVAGSVTPPRIDTGNEELIRAHVHAIWLAQIRLRLGSSIEEILDLSDETHNYPLNTNAQGQLDLSPVRRKEIIQAVKDVLKDCGSGDGTPAWLTEEWITSLVDESPKAFDMAFNRWRELYKTAVVQSRRANDAMIKPSRDPAVKEEAERMHKEATRQIQLLCNMSSSRNESDFYPYRYLASEGFLPGYNFPRLPIRAFLRTSSDGGEYVSRPRFLALTEFGPNAILYHEGNTFTVNRMVPPPGGFDQLIQKAKICNVCGYYHPTIKVDTCEFCKVSLEGNCDVVQLIGMTNVTARRRQRITSDEEERSRMGFEVTGHYRFAQRGADQPSRIMADICNQAGKPLFHLTYGPSATMYRINHGWRIQKERSFHLDMTDGRWVGTPDEDDTSPVPDSNPIESVKLVVNDTMNILLIRPAGEEEMSEDMLATLQYAIQRGIEQVFQVDEMELASVRIGTGPQMSVLLWEASEGGAGVLHRLVTDSDAVAAVARAALIRCHFDPDTGADLKEQDCPQACYNCLLSYSNQSDYRRLNRHIVHELLTRLTESYTVRSEGDLSYDDRYEQLMQRTDRQSPLERDLLTYLHNNHMNLPDEAQKRIDNYYASADFFYQENIIVFCDGGPHMQVSEQKRDEVIREELRMKGYRVIVIRSWEDLASQVSEYPDIFGKTV